MKSVIFDLDDTLCDYQDAKKRAINSITGKLAGLIRFCQ